MVNFEKVDDIFINRYQHYTWNRERVMHLSASQVSFTVPLLKSKYSITKAMTPEDFWEIAISLIISTKLILFYWKVWWFSAVIGLTRNFSLKGIGSCTRYSGWFTYTEWTTPRQALTWFSHHRKRKKLKSSNNRSQIVRWGRTMGGTTL